MREKENKKKEKTYKYVCDCCGEEFTITESELKAIRRKGLKKIVAVVIALFILLAVFVATNPKPDKSHLNPGFIKREIPKQK